MVLNHSPVRNSTQTSASSTNTELIDVSCPIVPTSIVVSTPQVLIENSVDIDDTLYVSPGAEATIGGASVTEHNGSSGSVLANNVVVESLLDNSKVNLENQSFSRIPFSNYVPQPQVTSCITYPYPYSQPIQNPYPQPIHNPNSQFHPYPHIQVPYSHSYSQLVNPQLSEYNNFVNFTPTSRIPFTPVSPVNAEGLDPLIPNDQKQIKLEKPQFPYPAHYNSQNNIRNHLHNLKLPPFWKEMPKGWFEFIESKFEAFPYMSDNDKYNSVISVLDGDVRLEIRDIVERPPLVNKYGAVRDRIEEVFSQSVKSRVKKLFSPLELGDRRPSQLLRHMQSLAGESWESTWLTEFWIGKLPKPVQAGLASLPESFTTAQYAKAADNIYEALGSSFVNSMSTTTFNNSTANLNTSSASSKELELTETIAKLNLEIAQMKLERVGRPHERNFDKGNPRQRSRSRSFSRKNSNVCWYHYKFGVKATKCAKPCNFVNEAQGKHNAENF